MPGSSVASTRRRACGGSAIAVSQVPADREVLFLFDYGDEWHFGVKLVRAGEVEPGTRYPRVVAGQGEAPPQYSEAEEDWDEEAAEEHVGLLGRFAAWAAARGAADAVGTASSLLEYKSLDGDGDLGRWTAADLRDFLLEWCPRHLALPDDKVPRAIPDVRMVLGSSTRPDSWIQAATGCRRWRRPWTGSPRGS
jgi:hypothetical protein